MKADRMKAFVLTMPHSGLRIGDTIALKRERVKGNKLFLYTQKTGTPVYVSLLENGVSIENVSVLLGHSSVRITERHYRPWVKTLQKKLKDEVRKTRACK